VGCGCNHLGWHFDEILGLVVGLYSRFKCPPGFLLYLMSIPFQVGVILIMIIILLIIGFQSCL